MRLSLILGLGSLLFLVPAQAQEEEPTPTYYSHEEWSEWKKSLRDFDEVRMTLAEKWVPFPIRMKKDGTIEFTKKRVLDTPLYDREAITDAESFIQILEFKPRVQKLVHGCYGLFNLSFYRKGELIGSLHFAHGKYWQPLTSRSQTAISHWLVRHGFPLEETIKLERQRPDSAQH